MQVYIKKQNDCFTKNSSFIARQKCGNRPYEIALRFAGCNLRWGACFASGYSWPEKYRKNRDVFNNIPINTLVNEFNQIPSPIEKTSYNWLRILGGEPL